MLIFLREGNIIGELVVKLHRERLIYSDVWNFTAQPISITAKVFLQGPYSGGDTMNTKLNREHFIPLCSTLQD